MTGDAPSPPFLPAGPAGSVREGIGKAFTIAGRRIAVFRHEGLLYALDDGCTHGAASLAFGSLRDGCVACPWHYGEFDLATGEPRSLPVYQGVNTYPVREVDGIIEVCVPERPATEPGD